MPSIVNLMRNSFVRAPFVSITARVGASRPCHSTRQGFLASDVRHERSVAHSEADFALVFDIGPHATNYYRSWAFECLQASQNGRRPLMFHPNESIAICHDSKHTHIVRFVI